jgi:predicted amino acid dehydrogenase
MSCNDEFFFKRSDPFVWPLWLYDADPTLDLPPDDPARGVTIDGSVSFECQINDQYGNFIATMQYEPYADQVLDKGWFVIKNSEPTDNWPIGLAVTDVKVIIDGVHKHSINFEFEIQGVQTP